jgi:hypothetical protein
MTVVSLKIELRTTSPMLSRVFFLPSPHHQDGPPHVHHHQEEPHVYHQPEVEGNWLLSINLGVTPVTLNKKDTQDYYFLVLRISGPRFRQKSPRDHSKPPKNSPL